MHHTKHLRFRRTPFLAAVLFLAACGASSGALPGASQPAASVAPEPVTTPEAAVARIVALEPRLAGIAAQDPDTIGASSWYVATPTDNGFDVEVYIGWGDCMAGCIEDHTWTYSVSRDGDVELVSEQGQDVPDGEWPSPAGG